jgi:hypothetical protein
MGVPDNFGFEPSNPEVGLKEDFAIRKLPGCSAVSFRPVRYPQLKMHRSPFPWYSLAQITLCAPFTFV